MQRRFTKSRKTQDGFSILEMLLATVILLVGLVAIAQLVPASILMNFRNRTDSSALVFAQRELDQMIAQPLNPPSSPPSFTDSYGNLCYLGDPTQPNQPVGTNVLLGLNNAPIIDFTSSVANYNFTSQDPTDPSGVTYDVRWAVITTGNGTTASSKRFILGVRQVGGNGYFQPITLDGMVGK
ncbi:MAG TPA: prepilin-type N-terminal cleavage/methylation domain-containing protein [Methylomirabilota bacterium]|nr:prepilin-type N-terminal cleavage/methylation domain-containing protein [Methylomirabilota bacterium]